MKRYLLIFIGIFALAACDSEPEATPVAAPLIAQQASDVFAKAAASSPIASQILNSPQEQDILATSRQAMKSVTASDVAEFETRNSASDVFMIAASDVEALPMPAACQAYYQRVAQCFSRQADGDGLLQMNQELKTELAIQQTADEKSCAALNSSFDAVANNLGCN